MPSGTKLLPEPKLIQICVAIKRHKATMCYVRSGMSVTAQYWFESCVIIDVRMKTCDWYICLVKHGTDHNSYQEYWGIWVKNSGFPKVPPMLIPRTSTKRCMACHTSSHTNAGFTPFHAHFLNLQKSPTSVDQCLQCFKSSLWISAQGVTWNVVGEMLHNIAQCLCPTLLRFPSKQSCHS